MPRDPMDDTPEEMAADRKWAMYVEPQIERLWKEYCDRDRLFHAMEPYEKIDCLYEIMVEKRHPVEKVYDKYATLVAERVAQEEYNQEEP